MTLVGESFASPAAIEVAGLSKHYPGVVALDDVTLTFRAGTATAILGENGAGKSTLMSILAGLQRPDSGDVMVDGERIRSFSPDALLRHHGVALVPQEIALCRERSITENVMLGDEGGILPSRRRMNSATRQLLDDVGMPIDPRRLAGTLSIAEQQMVLIVRALARNCRILILDEPTTSLTANEVEQLFAVLRTIRSAGATILFVSHRMPEIFELCECIHVLRDGRHVASFNTATVQPDELVTAMVGREIAQPPPRPTRSDIRTVLDVNNLTSDRVNGVSFHVSAGEIVGVAGLPDSGRSELVAAVFGATRATGTIRIDGTPVTIRGPRDAIQHGIGYVPAERRSQGIFPDMSVEHNTTILDLPDVSRFGVVRRSRLDAIARRRLEQFDVRGRSGGKITGLSGGNQQKVILARWLTRAPRLLVLDDPTRGVDIGAKADIHHRVALAAATGTAVLMASSDLPELLHTCDRIIVMADGHIAGTVERDQATEERVMTLATGTSRTDLPGNDR